MPELRAAPPPPRKELIERLAARLHAVVPGFRPLASDLLADRSRIDVFGVAEDGGPVLALIGQDGEELILLARALAQREWLAPRLPDWLKLAPDLGVRSELPVRALVLCPGFGPESQAALGSLEGGSVQLVAWRYVRNGSEGDLLLEPLAPAGGGPPGPDVPDAPAGFRTGLTERDLGLSEAELAEFSELD